jgi:hypothetical protein
MSLEQYFDQLIKKVESSDTITNQGKDAEGFFKPTKTVLLRHLQMLKDLHAKPLAKPMLRAAWSHVVDHVPPEWLVLKGDEKEALRKMLGD